MCTWCPIFRRPVWITPRTEAGGTATGRSARGFALSWMAWGYLRPGDLPGQTRPMSIPAEFPVDLLRGDRMTLPARDSSPAGVWATLASTGAEIRHPVSDRLHQRRRPGPLVA